MVLITRAGFSQWLAFLASCTVVLSQPQSGMFAFEVTQYGNFRVSVRNSTWITGGVGRLRVDGEWLWLGHGLCCTSNIQCQPYVVNGVDDFGSYNGWALNFSRCDSVLSPPVVIWQTRFLLYSVSGDQGNGLLRFEQYFPTALQGTAFQRPNPFWNSSWGTEELNVIKPLGEFPSFDSSSSGLRFAHWSRDFNNGQMSCDAVNSTAFEASVGVGLSSVSPVVFFQPGPAGASGDAVVISPTNNFKLVSYTVDPNTKRWNIGLSGEVTAVEAGTRSSTMLYAGAGDGVRDTVLRWGSLMLQAFKLKRLEDLTLQWVGYFTDNGSWCTNGFSGDIGTCNSVYFEQLSDSFEAQAIPAQYLMLDDWWYPGEPVLVNCTYAFEPRKDLFPSGLEPVMARFPRGAMLYMGWFCRDNAYRNNGTWAESVPFIPGNQQVANPLGYRSSYQVYSILFEQASKHARMRVFEVDGMAQNFGSIPQFRMKLDAATDWMQGMGDAAVKYQFPIQFCTAMSSDVLQSLTLPSLTQIRASTDYANSCNSETVKGGTWNIGASSLWLSALKIAPSKDVLFTRSDHYMPGTDDCPRAGFVRDVLLDVMIATLSTGPLSIGDGIHQTNTTLLRMSMRTDGRLLQPDHPITVVDRMFSQTWTAQGNQAPPGGQLWSTSSTVSGLVFHYVFGIDLESRLQLRSNDLWPRPSHQQWVWRPFHPGRSCRDGSSALSCDVKQGMLSEVSISTPRVQRDYGLHAYELLTLSPVGAGGWALLGEFGKIVAVSRTRFLGLSFRNKYGIGCDRRLSSQSTQIQIRRVRGQSESEMSVMVEGVWNETVSVAALSPANTIEVQDVVIPAERQVCLVFRAVRS